jgi:hypothetical protein
MVLTIDRLTKTAPSGKQILKNVGLAMFKVRFTRYGHFHIELL